MFSSEKTMEERYVNEELLASISELFLTCGLRSTSMDDISAHLKMSKKTLYQTFKNKNDVVEQVMLYRLRTRHNKEVLERADAVSPIRFLNRMKNHIIEDLKTLLPSNFFDLKKYHPDVYKLIRDENHRIVSELLTDILERGIQEGYFYKETNIPVQVYLLTCQLIGLKQSDKFDTEKYALPEVISTIIDNFILALSTSQGIKEYKQLTEPKNDKNKQMEK